MQGIKEKQQIITVINHIVAPRKNPQNDHRRDCVPICEDVTTALGIDREMRSEVRDVCTMLMLMYGEFGDPSKPIVGNDSVQLQVSFFAHVRHLIGV